MRNDHEFRRSSYCTCACCVEFADDQGERRVVLRNSDGPTNTVAFTYEEWAAFLQGVKAGEFDV